MREQQTSDPQPTLQERSPVKLGEAFVIPGRHSGALEFDLGMKNDWKDISLKIVSPKPGEVVADDSLSFEVELEGYETEPGAAHVHVKVDDLPYQAYYRTEKQPFRLDLKELGLEPGVHMIRAFPARPWHESIKAPNTFAATYFYYKSKTAEIPNLNGPLLTYSRPKGKYEVTPQSNRILFDYYISGVELGAGEYSVRYTLDDRLPMTLINWAPVWFEALEAGEHTIKVELLDQNGSIANVPYNPAEQTFEVVLHEEDGA